MGSRSPLALALLVAGCAATPSSPRANRATAAPSLFDFHVGFWVNLHQRLYAESSPRPVRDPLVAATAAEQATWDGAVALYRARYPDRGILTQLFNDELRHADAALAAAEAAPDLAAADLGAVSLSPALRDALAAAAPVYRRAAWPADERADRDFIARLSDPVARLTPSLAPLLARSYQSAWPAAPIRVDVAIYAGPLGAYTISAPAHITIASRDPRHAGDAAVEILFHEASHVLVEPLERAIAAACAARKQPVPPTLWHAALFYTTGELVRRQLGPGYTPYADRNGLWTRGPDWAPYRALLEQHWRPYLDGKRSFAAAVDALVSALPPPPS
jgi:hypothetical protein